MWQSTAAPDLVWRPEGAPTVDVAVDIGSVRCAAVDGGAASGMLWPERAPRGGCGSRRCPRIADAPARPRAAGPQHPRT
jgi:hypothetical protein